MVNVQNKKISYDTSKVAANSAQTIDNPNVNKMKKYASLNYRTLRPRRKDSSAEQIKENSPIYIFQSPNT